MATLIVLKIDRSFISEIATDPNSSAIVDAIITMAQNMHLSVIAEGVETEAQLAALRVRGCNQIQGFLFSGALPPDDLSRLMHEGTCLALPDMEESNANRAVLIVDDEPNVIAALRRALSKERYEVLTAGSGEEGLDILARHNVGVVLSDQRMPGISGTEFLRRVMAMYPDTVRMILSGYKDLNTITDSINTGYIFKFISKPWNEHFLRTCIKEGFNAYKVQRHMRLKEA
jgi:CheY-like chemotaxis protein